MAASKVATELKAARQRKKHMTPFEEWEAATPKDYYIRCAYTLFDSSAFLDLTHAAKITLLYMLREAAGKRDFHFPLSSYQDFISRDGFQKVVKQLEAHGFIETVGKNKNLRKMNDYRFSSDWWRADNPK